MNKVPSRKMLATHEVTNQPGAYGDVNLYTSDIPLREAVLREAGPWLDQALTPFGAVMGASDTLLLGEQANRFPPELVTFDRYGGRLDEARFHPAYHELMSISTRHRVHDLAWTDPGQGAHCAHVAMLTLFSQVEAGVMCPINMTYSVVPVLRADPHVGAPWEAKIIGGQYDAPLAPIATKKGVTMGMAMTEKQGGSDVRANSTRATKTSESDRSYVLRGHKWFCSAPMSDGFLTLAYTDAGLSCFLVPRVRPDGSRNAIQVMRLKDKLGNKSNASSEIEYHDAYAELIGEEGRGINVIIEMVHHTRLGTISGSTGMMRGALAQALHHISGRRAFQKTLIDQPMMRRVVAELALDYEAAVALSMRIAGRFGSTAPEDRAFARLAVALAKYQLTKRAPDFIYECMECHGGAGYVEESMMPRLYREAPVNAIWEGSGNIIALDVLRTIHKEPAAVEAYFAEIAPITAQDSRLRAKADHLKSVLASGYSEAQGRWIAETMTVLLQASILMRDCPNPVSDGFMSTRVEGGSQTFGAGLHQIDDKALLDRAWPN